MISYENYEKLGYRIKEGDNTALEEMADRITNSIELPLLAKAGYPFVICNMDLLESQLKIIERLYKEVSSTHENYLEIESYNSCSIEGAVTTMADTMRVSQERKAKNNSEKMVLNTIKSIEYLEQNKQKLTHSKLIDLWKIVVEDVCENNEDDSIGYRKKPISVGNNTRIIYEAPHYVLIEEMLENLFKYLETSQMHPIIKSIVLHFYFVYVHPFCDGNGRVARLLLSDYLINNGFDKFNKISITSEIIKDLGDYYKSIELSETNKHSDLTFFVVYYLNKIETVLLRAKYRFRPYNNNTYTISQYKLISWINKSKGRSITVKGYSKLVDIDADIAQAELSDLVNKMYLKEVNGEYSLNTFKGMEIF